MQFTYTGNNTRFLEQSFFDPNGALAVDISLVSPLEAVITHTLYTQANVFVVLRGLGFDLDAAGNFRSGVITELEFNGLEIEQARVTDINWSAEAFQDALVDIAERSDFSGLAQLFNSSPQISVDASNGLGGFDQETAWAGFLPLITRPILLTGSRFDEIVAGSGGDDYIDTGTGSQDGDTIVGSFGSDTIAFSAPKGSNGPGYVLDYDGIDTPVTFAVDGVTETATVSSATFTDTLLNVGNALSEYLGMEGTAGADTYDIRLSTGQVASMIGGPGADVYTVDPGAGLPILDFLFSDATAGLELDFASGLISNDGFGNSEVFTFTTLPELAVLFATDLNDRVSDGPGDQLVRLYNGDDLFLSDLSGDDSIDGGNGDDTVRFDTIAQGEMTLSFEGTLTTVTDRSDPAGRATLLSVETLETEGGVQLELDKHDGIGQISADDLTTLTELYIAYFDRAADALGLSFWATAFSKNGFTFDAIADLFFTQPETVALYSGVSDGDFVTAVYNNVLGRAPDQAGFDFWTEQLGAGTVTESGFILDLLDGARAATGSAADVAFIEAKTDLGLYFAVIQGQNDLTAANDVMDAFDGSAESLATARSLSDAALADAQSGSTDLLMPVIGVIDNPFAAIA
ncbi:MAG: DUF4214 domain-containing protein [Marivita sp.]|uniref:DUF4214 domain-containing protein n=1 Tax=Marivita sp. TaxID=2003365 RepID=UPI0025BBE5C8|nr:DUF4214 domain-containing protein [Marivita sp.]MCI5110982.1 DUF4214 domain-containing protein [Marivita sp.]